LTISVINNIILLGGDDMLNHVIMKEYAVAEFEIDKEKTKDVINALSEAIESLELESDKDEFTNQSICRLIDLRGMFQSIEADFRD
jgi:hypothetical protein